MRVTLLKPWKWMRAGRIFNDMPDGVANMLLKRGIAKEEAVEPAPEPAPLKEFKRRQENRVRA